MNNLNCLGYYENTKHVFSHNGYVCDIITLLKVKNTLITTLKQIIGLNVAPKNDVCIQVYAKIKRDKDAKMMCAH